MFLVSREFLLMTLSNATLTRSKSKLTAGYRTLYVSPFSALWIVFVIFSCASQCGQLFNSWRAPLLQGLLSLKDGIEKVIKTALKCLQLQSFGIKPLFAAVGLGMEREKERVTPRSTYSCVSKVLKQPGWNNNPTNAPPLSA